MAYLQRTGWLGTETCILWTACRVFSKDPSNTLNFPSFMADNSKVLKAFLVSALCRGEAVFDALAFSHLSVSPMMSRMMLERLRIGGGGGGFWGSKPVFRLRLKAKWGGIL